MSEEKKKRIENIWDAFNTQPREGQLKKPVQPKIEIRPRIEPQSNAENRSRLELRPKTEPRPYAQPKEEKRRLIAFQTPRFALSRGKKIFIAAILLVAIIGTFVYISDIYLFSIFGFFYHDKIVTHSSYLQSSKISYGIDENVVINLRAGSGFSDLCDIYVAGPDKSFRSYKTTKCEDIDGFMISPDELGDEKGQYSILIASGDSRDFVQFERL